MEHSIAGCINVLLLVVVVSHINVLQFRPENRKQRVAFCRKAIDTWDKFRDCVFTGLCTVQLKSKRRAYSKRGDKLMAIRSKVKQPVKLNIWAGVSARGATKVMKSEQAVSNDKH